MTKVIFFGNEKLATGISSPELHIQKAVIELGFEIEQVVTGRLSELKPHEAKIAVLAAYGRIIPQSVLDEFPVGVINIHPSLLPQYRGTAPIEQAILDGVQKTGVSIMRLTAGMDEGPIYKQKTLHLNNTETKQELTNKLQLLGAEMLKEILPQIADGTLKPRSQPHPDRATYTRKIDKTDGIIDWTKPAQQIEREIRAFDGWPQSRTKLSDVDIIITKASVVEIPTIQPGKILVEKDDLIIGTSKNCLKIQSLKPIGKKEMPVKAFLAGYRSKLIA
ncbi:MAG: methionyl-tRNA formyltransferase [Candidatus Saccharimonadales bacterium]